MASGSQSGALVGSTPEYWTANKGPEGEVLTYAVRGGRYQALIIVLGAALVAGALALAAWLLIGGEIAIAGLIFIVVVPGACLAAGAHCLDIALRARTEYRLAPEYLTATRYAIWGNRRQQVARSRITRISRRYARPADNMPAGTKGTWGVVVVHQDDAGRERELPIDGTHVSEEATWLRKRLAGWARISAAEAESDAEPAPATPAS